MRAYAIEKVVTAVCKQKYGLHKEFIVIQNCGIVIRRPQTSIALFIFRG